MKATLCCRSGVFAIFSLAALLFLSGLCQAQTTANQPPVRDGQAVEAIQQTLFAMSTSSSALIRDYTITGVVAEEHGIASNSPISISGINSKATSVKMSLHSGEYKRINQFDEGLTHGPSSQPRILPGSISLEATPYFFVPLLVSALADPAVGLRYVAPVPSDEGDIHVRMERRSIGWKPHMDFLFTGFLDFYINPTTHLIDVIQNDARMPTNIDRTQRHYAAFSEYRPEAGWLVPHEIKESYKSGPWLTIKLSSFSFNRGLELSSFPIR